VHGDKELLERLGRNDPCPCGSGRRFRALLPQQRQARRRRARLLLSASARDQDGRRGGRVSDPAAAFAAIAERLRCEAGVSEGTGFGANAGLRVDGKIFAMLVRGELVVKWPELASEALAFVRRSRST
jgi:SEC-C motif